MLGRSATRMSGRRTVVATLVVVVAVIAAATGWLALSSGPAPAPVVVTAVLGMTVDYARSTPQYLGGPVCSNCPVSGMPGARLVVTVWWDWVTPRGGPRGVNLTAITIDSPFRFVGTMPGLPVEVLATSPLPETPGNGSWSYGDCVLTLVLVAPSTPGQYSVGGSVYAV